MEESRSALKKLTSKPTGKRWERGKSGREGRTILEWILNKQASIRGIGLIRLRIGIIGEPL